VNDLRIRTGSDVLCDRGEAGAGFREAISEAGLARELVLKPIQIEHEQRVVAGGFEERVVPLKRGEALRGAFVVEGLEELALRVVHLELRARVRGNKKRNEAARKTFRLPIAAAGRNLKVLVVAETNSQFLAAAAKKNSKALPTARENFSFPVAAERNLEFLMPVKISRERERH